MTWHNHGRSKVYLWTLHPINTHNARFWHAVFWGVIQLHCSWEFAWALWKWGAPGRLSCHSNGDTQHLHDWTNIYLSSEILYTARHNGWKMQNITRRYQLCLYAESNCNHIARRRFIQAHEQQTIHSLITGSNVKSISDCQYFRNVSIYILLDIR